MESEADLDAELDADFEKLAAGKTPDERKLEIDLWRRWKTKRDPEAFNSLFTGYQGLLANQIRREARGANIPASPIMSDQARLFEEALDSYKPEMAQLNTHIQTRLHHVTRYVRRYQNIARVPEDHSTNLGRFTAQEAFLGQKLGRSPTTDELADYMTQDMSSIADKRKLRRNLAMFSRVRRKEHSLGSEPLPINMAGEDKIQTKLHQLYHELLPEQKNVLEHRYGLFGQLPKAPDDIATELSMTPARVRTVAKQINKRLNEMLIEDPGALK